MVKWMIRLLVSSFFFITLSIAAYAIFHFAANMADKRKGIYQHAEDVDFGDMPVRTMGQKAVDIANPYPVTIEIVSVVTSCACSRAIAPVSRLASGERSSILVKMEATEPAGRQRATLNITYRLVGKVSTKTESKLLLANATDYAVFSESMVDFGMVGSRNVEIDQCITVVRSSTESRWDTITTDSDAGLSVSSKQEESNKWLVRCTPTQTPWTTGPIHGKINVHFLSGGKTIGTKSIPVHGYVRGLTDVKPQSLFFGVVEPGHSVTKKFSLIKGESQMWKNIYPQWRLSPSFKITEIDKEGMNYVFCLEISAPEKAGMISDTAVATFTNATGSTETICVPFSALVK